MNDTQNLFLLLCAMKTHSGLGVELLLLTTSKFTEMMVCFMFRPLYSLYPLDRANWTRKLISLSSIPYPTELPLIFRIYACNWKIKTIWDHYNVLARLRLTPCDTVGQVLQFHTRLRERYQCSMHMVTSVSSFSLLSGRLKNHEKRLTGFRQYNIQEAGVF